MNNKILNKRWLEVDKKLSTFYSDNTKLNKKLYEDLQNIFNGIKFTYEELYSYADTSYIAKLRVEINNVEFMYDTDNSYTWSKLKQLSKRTKLKNNEVLNGLILVAYYKNYLEQKSMETKTFDEIINAVYKESQEETISVLNKNKLFKKKPKLLTIPNVFLLQLIGMESFNGYKWYEYKDGNISYNSKKMYELVRTKMSMEKVLNVYNDDFMRLLHKQENFYFNKKKDYEKSKRYQSEFSGMLDNEICFIVNQTALQGIKAQGCKKVQFIAVLDEHTTEMCGSLDGQIFNIDDWNTFSRYSKEDGKNVIYKTKGLVVGANLPPINNGFHYCRSTIYPYR